MRSPAYKTSFTSGGLFYREGVQISTLFMELKDWRQVGEVVRKENLLQSRTTSSSVRTTREVMQRMQTLTQRQLEILTDGSRQEQNQILWLAACKHYRLIREFAVEVLREKFLRMDLHLTRLDFEAFFNQKAEWDADLDRLTASTKEKLRQVVFQMLREAEIASATHSILPAVLSPRVREAISRDDPDLFLIYPISSR